MKFSFSLLALLAASRAQAKAVFAHFMVEYTSTWDQAAWQADISLAQQAHIDAFALNIRKGDPTAQNAVSIAFQAAEATGFQLLFSFDYAGGGPWDMNDVINYINQYKTSSAYFKNNGKPFVSTFEGPGNAVDWITIKAKTGCFFMPDWSSEGAKAALALQPGVPDGLFSWAAWPWGATDMDTYVDASYLQYLNQTGTALPYMMPVSPWFFTNLLGYDKNWLWRGDDMWFERWNEVWYVNPDFVEIITWNDFGESHYIGPTREEEFNLFSLGRGPFNYAENMPHDGWRLFLPYVIDMYKTGTATISQEGLQVWYRLSPKAACGDGGTTGNTASQLQIEFPPADIVQDKIFFSALLASHQSVTVTVGGVDLGADWTTVPNGNIGIYHGSVDYDGYTGNVIVTVGSMVFNGEPITTSCNRVSGQNGLTNWNAWVGSTTGAGVHATPTLPISKQVCIQGTGANNFGGLCSFACSYGYCPIGACLCQAMGVQNKLPGPNTPGYGAIGYPAAGLDASYSGVCAFDCNYGYCPSSACDTVQHPLTTPTVSDFLPPACNAGTGEGNLAGLCSFACNFGYCPIHACTCTSQGPLNPPPPQNGIGGSAATGLDGNVYDDLCDFTCSRNYCPEGACIQAGSSSSGSFLVNGDPNIWFYPDPTVACYPPCTYVLPPYVLPSPTVITFPPYTTSLEVAESTGQTTVTKTEGASVVVVISTLLTYTTETTVIVIPPVTTTAIAWWNIILTSGMTSASIVLTSSILPPVYTTTNDPNVFPGPPGGGGPHITRTIHVPPFPWTTPANDQSCQSGKPPVSIHWTSGAPGPSGGPVDGGGPPPGGDPPPDTGPHGSRCIGLFCIGPCVDCADPDPDFLDPQDPTNPFSPENPYDPGEEECSTSTVSECSTACLATAAGAAPTCSESCSAVLTCDGEGATVSGTHTLAAFALETDEAWPTATRGSAYTSSVLAEVQSVLAADFPSATPPLTSGSNVYDILYWTCAGPTEEDSFHVGLTSASECDSLGLQIGLPAQGVGFNICGGQKTLGSENSQSGCFPVGTNGGSCCPFNDVNPHSCQDQDQNACTVYIKYQCTDTC